MRLPAVAIAAAFTAGIALGLHPRIHEYSTSVTFLFFLFAVVISLLLGGTVFVHYSRLFVGGLISLLCWSLLGIVASCIAQQPLPGNHVLLLLDRDQLELNTPLQWHGTLRDEPTKLPWGSGLEISLASVDYRGAALQLQGGLRLSFSPNSPGEALPDLHAGDEVSVVTQAKLPQVYKDEGAFDRRAYLAQQNIHLVATLRSPELIVRVSSSQKSFSIRLAQLRRQFRDEIDRLFYQNPEAAAVLRAMLLGDRTFVDQQSAVDFQKTGVFHILVVAGLHVGAIAFALFWAGRKLKLSPVLTALFTLSILLGYVAVVEQRPPVLRAALMAMLIIFGTLMFRRLELLNSAAIAALILMVASPLAIRDSSFQLTFLAIGSIAGIAIPWMERTAQPYSRALRGWRDVTRDAAHEPRAAQFRIDLRTIALWLRRKLPQRLGSLADFTLAGGLSVTFRIWELLALTLVLQLGMLPLMVRDFHRITLSAPIVNLFAVPLTGIVVPLGFLTLLVDAIVPAIGKLLAIPLGWITSFLVHLVQWFAHLSGWDYRIPGSPLWLNISFLVLATLMIVLLRSKLLKRKEWIAGVCVAWLAVAAIIAVFPFRPHWAAGQLEVSVLDVGQGDSLFVVTPGGKTLLVDGGGAFGGFPGREEHNGIDPGEEAVSPYLWSRGFKSLDAVALTHAHQDHLGGLMAILQNFHVGELWVGQEVSSPAMATLEALARSKGISVVHEVRGRSFSWDGVKSEFLWPEPSSGEIAKSPKNNDSLVLRLQYGSRSILLPGDAEKQAESQILSENQPELLQSDVLKIGHHGSKNSTTPKFLAAVQPHIAVISAGEDNPYGHPSPELVDRLRNAQVRILRTDRNGAIHILTDGSHIEVSCFFACPEFAENSGLAQAQTPNHN